MEIPVRTVQLKQEHQLDRITASLMIANTIKGKLVTVDVRISCKCLHQPPKLLRQHADQENKYLMIEQDAFNVDPTQELKIGIQFVLQMAAYLLSTISSMVLVENVQ